MNCLESFIKCFWPIWIFAKISKQSEYLNNSASFLICKSLVNLKTFWTDNLNYTRHFFVNTHFEEPLEFSFARVRQRLEPDTAIFQFWRLSFKLMKLY